MNPYPAGLDWEPLQVPSMDSIRRLVAEPGSRSEPSSRDWGGHSEVFAVVARRWRRAVRESCTHPSGFHTELHPNVLGEYHRHCPRCSARDPQETS